MFLFSSLHFLPLLHKKTTQLKRFPLHQGKNLNALSMQYPSQYGHWRKYWKRKLGGVENRGVVILKNWQMTYMFWFNNYYQENKCWMWKCGVNHLILNVIRKNSVILDITILLSPANHGILSGKVIICGILWLGGDSTVCGNMVWTIWSYMLSE